MKKILVSLFLLVFGLCLVGCKIEENTELHFYTRPHTTYQIADIIYEMYGEPTKIIDGFYFEKNDIVLNIKYGWNEERIELLLNNVDVVVTNCGTLGVTSSKEACANYFQYVSPKQGEYYTEFKEISWEDRMMQENEQFLQLQKDVDGLYDETIAILDSITDEVLEKKTEVEAEVE